MADSQWSFYSDKKENYLFTLKTYNYRIPTRKLSYFIKGKNACNSCGTYTTSVGDSWHFGADPDPDPQIRTYLWLVDPAPDPTSDPSSSFTNAKDAQKIFSSYNLPTGISTSVYKI